MKHPDNVFERIKEIVLKQKPIAIINIDPDSLTPGTLVIEVIGLDNNKQEYPTKLGNVLFALSHNFSIGIPAKIFSDLHQQSEKVTLGMLVGMILEWGITFHPHDS